MVQYMKLSDKELKNIEGGVSLWAILGGIAGIIFGIGALDGYVRPIKCRK